MTTVKTSRPRSPETPRVKNLSPKGDDDNGNYVGEESNGGRTPIRTNLTVDNETIDETENPTIADEDDSDTVDRPPRGKITFAEGTFRQDDTEGGGDPSREPLSTSLTLGQSADDPQTPTLSEAENLLQQPALEDLDPSVTSAIPSDPHVKRRRNRRDRIPKKMDTISGNSSKPEWKRRNRGRVARLANINTVASSTPRRISTTLTKNFPKLPGNQYSTTLRRRAIRKWEDRPEDFSAESNTFQNGDEIYGDISLGMKLIVVGGRVIVQTLKALSDGRASPAQLAGVVQRGDVLLAVGSSSLVNLPIDQLMGGLKPLSSPLSPDGHYKRILKVRMEVGAGHDLLRSHEEGLKRPLASSTNPLADGQGALNDMFTLFPMVDQLSGAPMFDEPHQSPTAARHENGGMIEQEPVNSEADAEPDKSTDNEGLGTTIHTVSSLDESIRKEATPDELISSLLVKEKTLDRKRFASAFFNWNEGLPELIRESMDSSKDQTIRVILTKSERVDIGTQVMKLTKNLTYNMEDMDKGKDLRSFKTWSSNFSLRSTASARRRHMMDAASIRSHRQPGSADVSGDESVGSMDSGSLGSIDGDALLLNLAAHDDIWRKQVVEALEKEITKMEGGVTSDDEIDERKEQEKPEARISEALSNEIGAFLFGKNMNEIITKKAKSHALPPEDITTVLFDLTTHIATTAPDEVTIFGGTTNSYSYQSSAGTQSRAKATLRADVALANQFILEEALPVWLKSFRPLGLEQRRLFWPKMGRGSTGSYTGTNTLSSDADSLTVDSTETSQNTTAKRKSLQEAVEQMELDVETRAETCFLVTYYFTQHILTQYMSSPDNEVLAEINHELAEFVHKYGTYLQIHSCLSFASTVEADAAVEELLKVASHDPSHKEAVKEIQKADDLTFYDVSKLSAVLKFLRQIRTETMAQRRKVIKHLSVAAYPDIQPWQVKLACVPDANDSMGVESPKHAKFYYSYLSLLLDPVEGVEAARQNAKLVKEWCALSVGVSVDGTQRIGETRDMDNFLQVVSRTSSSHLAYRRDVATLLEYCMVIEDFGLALDLAMEIVESRRLSKRQSTVRRVLKCLGQIGVTAVEQASTFESADSGFHLLQRVLKAFHQMSNSEFESCRESIVVAEELVALLGCWKATLPSSESNTATGMLPLIDFLIQESSPHDVLGALVLWSEENSLGPDLPRRLNELLRRGVQYSAKQELSGFLFRLKQLRGEYTPTNQVLKGETKLPEEDPSEPSPSGGIWAQMSIGTLSIDK